MWGQIQRGLLFAILALGAGSGLYRLALMLHHDFGFTSGAIAMAGLVVTGIAVVAIVGGHHVLTSDGASRE